MQKGIQKGRVLMRHGHQGHPEGLFTTSRALATMTLRKCHMVQAPRLHQPTIITIAPPFTIPESRLRQGSRLLLRTRGVFLLGSMCRLFMTMTTTTTMMKWTVMMDAGLITSGFIFASFSCFSPCLRCSLWSCGVLARVTSLKSSLRSVLFSLQIGNPLFRCESTQWLSSRVFRDWGIYRYLGARNMEWTPF